jgi:hypothetical protein
MLAPLTDLVGECG